MFRLSLFRGWYKVLTSFPEVWMKKNLMEFVVPLNGKQLPLAGLLSQAILKESNFVGWNPFTINSYVKIRCRIPPIPPGIPCSSQVGSRLFLLGSRPGLWNVPGGIPPLIPGEILSIPPGILPLILGEIPPIPPGILGGIPTIPGGMLYTSLPWPVFVCFFITPFVLPFELPCRNY